ncbi:4Fe-4S dicluster domain-containing protein [Desulforhopalus singaporensis]|uniref:Fe-S-cluster-containing dehydrogenase component n=1 Tax=Desulforhopalus singaporensis TaxID=91360 RepID=A0A1H0QD23_9BACT|nr:4Fe-4S dicluster domain-containing protein [Desulforhopalus singaporensis]SDP15252.1 Fe-S-cluster-containing dehydrogenase component [Desulforhopalus singaporensis]
MKKYMIHINSRRCIGCHGCEVHCKVNKGLPVGPILCEIDHSPLTVVGGVPKTEFTFSTCNHCDEPLCVPVCPTGAMLKREDSIVYIDDELCIGCMACKTACPWDIPEYNPVTDKAVKCDLCMDRLDAGLKPACVAKCMTHALKLVTLQEA